jgi:hypothetical protein
MLTESQETSTTSQRKQEMLTEKNLLLILLGIKPETLSCESSALLLDHKVLSFVAHGQAI